MLLSPYWKELILKFKDHQHEKRTSIFFLEKARNHQTFPLCYDAAKLQVHNIVSSNKVINQVSFSRELDKTNTKIIVNLQLFKKLIKIEN